MVDKEPHVHTKVRRRNQNSVTIIHVIRSSCYKHYLSLNGEGSFVFGSQASY